MNRDKQKIISDICPFYKEYGTCDQCNTALAVDDEPCYWECIANAIINNDYRKQSVGEWVDKPTGAYCRMQSWCSACGKHSGIGGIESNRHKPFCPNCGAKMKGE